MFWKDAIFYLCLFLLQDTEPDDVQTKGLKMGILNIIDDYVAIIHSNPNTRCLAVLLEEPIVLEDVDGLPTAFALLLGLMYAHKMDYPKELKYIFDTIQKVGMHLDP